MYWLKGCPRCGGDLFEAWDPFAGKLIACLQCGHTLTDEQETLLCRAGTNARRQLAMAALE
ncbi:MAG: hypothetical protein HYS83_01865 [Candidatus Blackburnbacteria bacterium]|nr:hypothetical protein [Candidatus Blackburnbacteria bacterium]